MLLPLGFGMGPGIAFSIGQSWEAYGFEDGGSIGLTIAAIGFLVAYFSGMAIVNRGIRQGKSRLVGKEIHLDDALRKGIFRKEPFPEAGRLRLHGGVIEPMSFQLGLIGLLYLITYLAATGLEQLMRMGGLERDIQTLWSFHFLIGFLLAVAARKIMERIGGDHLVDAGLSHRLVGLFTDYLIATAIMGISLSVAWTYAVPISIMCLLGAIVTERAIRYVTPRVFTDHPFERYVGVYGEMTGTIASGLALVRVTDPELATPVAQDLGLGSGMALLFGFPLLVVINLPYARFDGQLYGYWIVMGICLVYLALIVVIWKRFGLNFNKPDGGDD
jgi:ESS family glutamate:Na+ symporter